MIILGIDPGLRTTGFGVIENHGAKLRYIASGTIKTGLEGALPPRLKIILDGVSEVVATYGPVCAQDAATGTAEAVLDIDQHQQSG